MPTPLCLVRAIDERSRNALPHQPVFRYAATTPWGQHEDPPANRGAGASVRAASASVRSGLL